MTGIGAKWKFPATLHIAARAPLPHGIGLPETTKSLCALCPISNTLKTKNGSRRSRFSCRGEAVDQAMPGLPSTPTIFGVLSFLTLATFSSRRYSATISQMGLPGALEPTVAQPATV